MRSSSYFFFTLNKCTYCIDFIFLTNFNDCKTDKVYIEKLFTIENDIFQSLSLYETGRLDVAR